MTKICRDMGEWVSSNVTEPVESWERRTEQRCKDYPWYDPRGWFCWLVVFFVKVINWVVKVVWTFVSKIVCEVVVTILNAAAFVVGLILSIPFIGPIIRAVIRTVAEIVSKIVGIFDMLARLVGIRIVKHVRVCIVILNDRRLGVASESDLRAAIEFAQDTFYRKAKVRLTVNTIRTVNDPSPRDNLDVDTNAGAVWNELWAPGSYFETAANGYCLDDAFARLAAIGGPIIVFVVRSVAGQATGCSLTFVTDYVTVERGTFVGPTADPTVMAHELAHAMSLPHVADRNNLMNPTSRSGNLRGSTLEAGQVSLLRSSRHVTFI
jgi:Metallo-peptidase family M12B Reprolysin-like